MEKWTEGWRMVKDGESDGSRAQLFGVVGMKIGDIKGGIKEGATEDWSPGGHYPGCDNNRRKQNVCSIKTP